MAKPLIPDGPGGSIQLRPQATPVDTFIRPVAPGSSALGQLAAALSGVAPELRQLGVFVSQREAEQEAARGEAFAADMEASKDAWAGLVKDGKVAPGQNPHFVLAAKRKFGQVAAGQFDRELATTLTKLGDNPTPEQFEGAVAEARKAFLASSAGAASNDLAFMGGFNSIAEQSIANARRAFAANSAKKFEEDATTAFASRLHSLGQAALDNPALKDADVAAIINKEADAWLAVNPERKGSGTMSGRSMAGVKAQVLFALMKSTGNPELIKRIAKQVKSGDGVLADDPAFFMGLEDVVDHVTNDRRTKEADERTAQQQAERDATATVTDQLLKEWKNGGAQNTAAAVATLTKAGVKDAAATVQSIVSKLPELDPTFYVGYRSRVANGKYPAISELDAAVLGNKISRPQYDALLNDIAQARAVEASLAQAGAATTESIWSRPEMKIIEDGIRGAAKDKATVNMQGFVTGYSGFTESDVTAAIAEAKIEMAQTLAANWSKYGSGAGTAVLAARAWRAYAYRHHIITGLESNEGQPVLPADAGKRNAITTARTKTAATDSTAAASATARNNAFVTYTRSEIQAMRADVAKWATMTGAQRTAWATDPRHRAIMESLGVKSFNDLGPKLAEAFNSAKP